MCPFIIFEVAIISYLRASCVNGEGLLTMQIKSGLNVDRPDRKCDFVLLVKAGDSRCTQAVARTYTYTSHIAAESL